MLFNIRRIPDLKIIYNAGARYKLGEVGSLGCMGSASFSILYMNNFKGVLHEYKVDSISILLDYYCRRDVDWDGEWQCVRCDFDVLVGARGVRKLGRPRFDGL
jgi:hypothetical protein